MSTSACSNITTVAIVTSASTAQGAAICRSLLNSNAFVLGIDQDAPHDSTRSGRGSHFQFLQCNLFKSSSVEVGEKIASALKTHFQIESVDFLVNVVGEGEDGVEKMARLGGALDGMAERGEGVVLNVANAKGGCDEADLISAIKSASSKTKKCGVRWNLLLPYNILSDSNHRFILDSDEREALQRHLSDYDTKRREGRHAREKEREVANLALFFCTSEGSTVMGALVGIDGTCVFL